MRQSTILTHSSRFHADDVCAVASLTLALPGTPTIIRTRDESLFDQADFVVDVGGLNDPAKNRFDHHQAGGAGKRPNSIPYASFGLVWKKYGELLAGSALAAERIDRRMVQPIDALDNGLDIFSSSQEDIFPYSLTTIVSSFVPTWREGADGFDAVFLNLVSIARQILSREITQAKDLIEAESRMEQAYETAEDKKLIILDRNYPWDEFMMKYPDVIFVVYPTPAAADGDGTWKVGTVRIEKFSHKTRKSLPESWAGKRDAELAKISGVPDATFCHNARFMAVARSKEGAIALAKKALLA